MPTPLLRRVALPLAAIVAVGLSAVASPAYAQAEALTCVEAGNVWIHVEHDEVVTGACATEFATGAEAMSTTGLAPDQGTFYTTVDDVTAQDPQWWSLWTAPVTDGALGEWVFSQVGAGDLKPEAGQVIGWRLLPDYNKPQEAPKYDPLSDSAEGADPTESSAPATSAAPEASTEAPSDSSSAPAEATASPEETPTAIAVDAEETPTGMPVGTIVGIVAVVALAGVGGFVWWRRRGQ